MSPRPAHSIDQVREILSQVGLRTTPARIALVHWLQKSNAPATHAEIAVDLIPMGIDKATVFRNLNDLTDAGIVSRTELGDHVWRFEMRDAKHDEQGQHPHFVCTSCGNVTCLHDLDLPKAANKSLSKVGTVTEVLIKGRCLSCK